MILGCIIQLRYNDIIVYNKNHSTALQWYKNASPRLFLLKRIDRFLTSLLVPAASGSYNT